MCTYTSTVVDVVHLSITLINNKKTAETYGKMFHLRAKIIGRSGAGRRSAAGAAAYRSGSRNSAAASAYRAGEALRDPRTGRLFDYSRKAAIDADGFGVLHTEIMLPTGAPEWLGDRQALVDAVEAREIRSDAQLFREIEVSLPRELTLEQQRELVREFARTAFVARGMVADISLHDERASDGGRNPHAHILLTLRRATPDGFGPKERSWNSTSLLREWRAAWAEMANEMLAAHGHERRLDPRSHRDRDIPLEPDSYVGPSKGRAIDGVLHADRQDSRKAVKQENIARLTADPGRLIATVSREKATFTVADLGSALRRATGLEPDEAAYRDLLASALDSSDLVAISSDGRGPARYATRDMIACEQEMAAAGQALARRRSDDFNPMPPNGLSPDQIQAFLHATSGPDLVAITGIAGAGKTTTLAAIAAAFEVAGRCVRGAALAAIAARKLTEEAGVATTTLASALAGWRRTDARGLPDPAAPLQEGDVFILDEAGLVGSRDMRRLLSEAARAKAKVILVGDVRQLQAIEAGAAFRAMVDTHGAAELSEVRRQRADWQRDASRLLADGRPDAALTLYRDAGAVQASASTSGAMDRLTAAWTAERGLGGSQIVLTHSRADATALNTRLRAALRQAGELGPDVAVTIREQLRGEDGELLERARRAVFAVGDRILFTKNDRALGVQNGATGRILDLEAAGRLRVELTGGSVIDFSTRDYAHVALGYAMTVHKAQGGTYDRTYFLASRSMDAHLGYVALTRHREATQIFYGRDQFPEARQLDQAFARQRPKDSTLDYLAAYHARERSGERAAGGAEAERRVLETAGQAPLSAAERIRQNVERRRRNLTRDRGRDRTYGE